MRRELNEFLLPALQANLMRDWINVVMVRFNVHCSISLPFCARFSVGDKSLLVSLECGINCDYCQLDVNLAWR